MNIQVKLIFLAVLFLVTNLVWSQEKDQKPQPNIIILLADDMGYGDLSSYGHPIHNTPNIDSLAGQGIRFTSFVTGVWCVPSRAQLMTGQYMPRIEFNGHTGADGEGGLPERVVTLAEALNESGYITGMAGKWHLGYKKDKFLPTNQGFDSWYGMPYSNDYKKPWVQTEEPLAIYRDLQIVEHPVDQQSLTTGYTTEAVEFINKRGKEKRDQPFFFYLAYNMPHLPLNVAEQFEGISQGGLYGDVMHAIDWSVGQVLEALEKNNLEENTIVFFASDNGPWLNPPDRMLQDGIKPWHAGSPGLLRGAKATTYEGGARVPAIIRWPNYIKPHQETDALVAMPDIYRTFIEVSGADLPDYPLDGYNLFPFLNGQRDESPRKEYAYFRNNVLEAMRKGEWKLRLVEEDPQLFNLQIDPAERYNRADEKPNIVNQIQEDMLNLANEVDAEIPE